MNIQYLTNQQIDKQKWDACIEDAPNGLVYGCSWWLDKMAIHWDALVVNDYEAVMPLTWNQKFGIKYLYQPAFCQQLGIFSKNEISPNAVEVILQSIPRQFKFAEIFLNYTNNLTGLSSRNNFILLLTTTYENIIAGYKKDLLNNLKRAANLGLSYREIQDIDNSLKLYRELYGNRSSSVSTDDFEYFRDVCMEAKKKDAIILRGVFDNQEKIVAIALMVQYKKRLYLLQSTTLPEGRKMEANHFLIDNVVKEFSGSNKILDFEGSDIPGIAHFYKNFGSVNEPYFFYRFNKLPVLIKWLK